MTERAADRIERDMQRGHLDARRVLSRYYLAEIDRINEVFLEDPDGRPNSGLREGGVSHAEVNAVIRRSEKTVIFGQQMRLRAGILMKEDEQLSRFHAGHEVVRYFYGAIRLIPDYLLDALFECGISVTMVKDRDLLIYKSPRNHQSFHTGRTRRTIYIPEGVLMSAFERGYHPWAFTEVLLQEAWKLLDYYLIVELARRYQLWMHQHNGVPGFYFVKDTLLGLNKHRRISGEHEQTIRRRFRRGSERGQRRQTKQYDEYDVGSTDTEYMQFYRHYYWDLYSWGRPGKENRPSVDTSMEEQAKVRSGDILLRDAYHVGNDTFHERRESAWATMKIDALKEAFGYPNEYQVDRDIVHPIAFDRARANGQTLEPQSVADLIHDLADAARFGAGRAARSEQLIAQLIAAGLPGAIAFYDAVAEEYAVGLAYVTDVADGFDAVEQCKKEIQALSTTGPEGVPNSVSNDVCDYLATRLLRQIGVELQGFMRLPKRERVEGRHFLRALTLKGLVLARPELDEAAREEMVKPPARDFGPSHHVSKLADVANSVLGRFPTDREPDLLFNILRKMDLHEGYHDVLLQQARGLRVGEAVDWQGDQRALASDLYGLVPERAHLLSTDPSGVRARLNRYDYTRREAPDSEQLLGYLVGVLIRLDRSQQYEDLVERVIEVGEGAVPALREVLAQLGTGQVHRQVIRQGALRALQMIAGLRVE
ncbi:MAG TPA: hypothetical protein EYG11_21015 [Candidatus Latescibacteria bacterium]|nr:hypothetical protein [Candidatus Handelsmanbacteria bacterium]HIL11185.1 hypothetical protein [Candidatus Latescibacterota bacterium]